LWSMHNHVKEQHYCYLQLKKHYCYFQKKCNTNVVSSNPSCAILILEILSTLSDRWDLCQQTSMTTYVPE
jgi:hypothetical protein